MGSAKAKKAKSTSANSSSLEELELLTLDSDLFREDLERHQIKIHQKPTKIPEEVIDIGTEVPLPMKKDSPKRRKRKKRGSFIKIKANRIRSITQC